MQTQTSQLPPIVLSVGGSIVVPKTGIDVEYLKVFRKLVVDEVERGRRFILVVGGGSTARQYQKATNMIAPLADEDTDWLGIHATRLNGHLLRTVFRDVALHYVVKDPTRRLSWKEPVLIAAGWKPGFSTDYIAVRLAKKYKAKCIVNLTNIDAVYDKDPSTHEDAEPFDQISWKEFRKIVGDVWSPGANAPFDPVASKFAQRWGLEVKIVKGTDLKNVQRAIDDQKFQGTVIRQE